jgi:hypothetical protein
MGRLFYGGSTITEPGRFYEKSASPVVNKRGVLISLKRPIFWASSEAQPRIESNRKLTERQSRGLNRRWLRHWRQLRRQIWRRANMVSLLARKALLDAVGFDGVLFEQQLYQPRN